MKAFLALGVKKSVPDEVFAKSFSKSNFLDLVKIDLLDLVISDILDLTKFTTDDRFLKLLLVLPAPLLSTLP